MYFLRWFCALQTHHNNFLLIKSNSTFAIHFVMVDWSGGQSTPAGKATAEDPAGSGFASEEAEALPAESDCPQRKSTSLFIGFMSKNNNSFRWG